MKIGEKYLFMDDNGELQQRIWIESSLDKARYFNGNIYCPQTYESRAKVEELEFLWDCMGETDKRQVNFLVSRGVSPLNFFQSPKKSSDGSVTIYNEWSYGHFIMDWEREFWEHAPQEVIDDYLENYDPFY